MRDPQPENISGEKVQRHVFKHEIDWGHVALAAAGIYALYRFGHLVGEGNDEEDGGYTGR